MKKSLVSALTTALVVGAASTTFAAANPFSDVAADHWAYDAVAQLAQEGIVNGYADSSFQGDTTMTRYEMAQIVAKAMAKQDTVNASQKAMIDKLAAEFSDELANLGVRVAALENKVDNVTWSGWARYQYKQDNSDWNDKISKGQKMHIRMNIAAKVNDNWTVYSRLKADNIDMNDTTDGENPDTDWKEGSTGTEIDRVWAQGDYDNLTVKLGRYTGWSNATHGMLLDDKVTGAEVTFGKVIKTRLAAGRVKAGANASILDAEVRYVADKLDVGVEYMRLGSSEFGKALKDYSNVDKYQVAAVGVGYKFDDKWSATADYAKSTKIRVNKGGLLYNDDIANYRLQVTYGKQDINVAKSWDVAVQYQQRGLASGLGNDGDWLSGNSLSNKGWAVVGHYTFTKNIMGELAYFRGKDTVAENSVAGTGLKRDLSVVWGQLQFAF